jgi:glycosyltransferase involved in cell wall biosynthesis
MFSVVILTLNEEKNLPRCLESTRGLDDIVVLDSGSTDGTAEIAEAAGARVVIHPFENFASQRNYADHAIAFKHPWVFHLDADEQLTPELAARCHQIAQENPDDVDGFWIAPRMIFRGRWIPRCTDFPAYQARFVHAQRFSFIQVGHGQREAPSMRLRALPENYLHDLSADGEAEFVSKHKRYARQEAAEFLARASEANGPAPRLFAQSPLERRRALKALSKRLPAPGALRFVYQYFLRRGFLDGSAGLAYCRLMAKYESWIAQEIAQQRRRTS